MDGFTATKTCKVNTHDNHILHVEVSGPSNGIPVLFLHGGPGASIGQNYQSLFAGSNFHLVAFDQRGCGRSQPFGSLENNNIHAIIEDIELIRKHLGIEKWLLFGGSWGSTLALVYAIKHPTRVSGMVLRGIFLGRLQDADWFISKNGGAAQIFNQAYQTYIGDYTAQTTSGLCEQFYTDLLSEDESTRRDAATRWFNWEGRISRLTQNINDASNHASWQQVYTLALFECHYLINKCFIDENFIIDNCLSIANIPTHIVHGRYDVVCKSEAATTLHKHLPKSTLHIVEDAGHSMLEKGISSALSNALALMGKDLRDT